MKRTFTKSTLVLLMALGMTTLAFAQQQGPLNIALRYLEQNYDQWELTEQDIQDVVLRDRVYSKHNGTTHFYFNQRHEGIEVYNAINGLHVQDNEVKFATNRFVAELATKVNTTQPSLSPQEAIIAAAKYYGLQPQSTLRLKKEEENLFTFYGGEFSNSDINVELVYQLEEDGNARLAWDLALDMPTSVDYWSVRVDALSGLILDEINWTVKCSFHTASHQHSTDCGVHEAKPSIPLRQALIEESLNTDGAVYNVYPVPYESPNDGPRELAVNPADTLASPFGWHDTDGVEGPEFTITRGNNAHAYLDLMDDNTSMGDEPDGGEELIFDFPLDLMLEPDQYREAAVTQLFYMTNMMHDITYYYGFDEEAGTFQANNYGNGGAGNDPVIAQAQDGSELPAPNLNNANFATPPDGNSGRMQMYLWNSNSSVFTVNSPQSIAGGITVGTANFGPPIDTTPITAEVVVVDDGSLQPSLGCESPVNGDQLAGKIALIDRGVCEFGLKVLNAQQAGAIGAIICNFENAVINMAGGAVGGQVSIPSVFMQNSDCQAIRQFAGNGLVVTMQVPSDTGPQLIDGDLDNGIIAHEYGHGISNRLTGGPSAAGCLGNDEQMGEGWSDYFSLVTSAKEGDTGEMGRGIGTFAQRQPSSGPGIRRQRYSTDMNLNDQVLDDIIGTGAPHPLGEVWAVVNWDLYWALVDEYGWDPDVKNGTGGNNIAIQLFMDGMKLQSCSPGFEDGRDAILAADLLNYDGIHECLIWEVFARRGMGFFMDQNSSNNRNDNVQNFDTRPECIRELKIVKEATDLIAPGGTIEVSLTVTNHKGEPVSGVIVEDLLPAGTSFVAGSESGAEATTSASAVSFEIGEMADGDVVTITYSLEADEAVFSTLQFEDDVESGGLGPWFFDNIDDTGSEIWQISDLDAVSGERSWYVENVEAENDQVLFLQQPLEIVGSQPVLRFTHRFDTEARVDGGFIEFSTDGVFWTRAEEQVFRNGYRGPLAYGTLAIPNVNAFTGSEDWMTSYVDMSEFVGQEVNFRFRFASDETGIPNAVNPGWFVDDIQVLDMVNFDTEACVMSDQGDMACDQAPERGTIVDVAATTNTIDQLPQGSVKVFPNPASDLVNVAIDLEQAAPAVISVMSMDGRLLQQQRIALDGAAQIVPLQVSQLPAGMYMIKVQAGSRTSVEKVVLR